jgi:hypothetical protein
MFKPKDLNRDWSPQFLYALRDKTAAFERKRSEI